MTTFTKTPQSQPIQADQVRNRAGGHVFQINLWSRLDRFLLLGSEGGDYYSTQRELTAENTQNLRRCLRQDGARLLRRVLTFREEGRSLRQQPCIYALALALKEGDLATRRLAAEITPRICSTASQLFALAAQIEALGGGWGRVTKRAFANWYLQMPTQRLAYQLLKYRQRQGWTHRDLLRKAHPRCEDPRREKLLGWAIEGWSALDDRDPAQHLGDPDGSFQQLAAFELLQGSQDVDQAAALIREQALPWEAVPTQLHRSDAIWDALLDRMPMQAMLRNLARMTANGLLWEGSAQTQTVARRLRDGERLQAARLHPMMILNALRIYASGQGMRSELCWEPVQTICDALQEAFYLAFEYLEPSGARIMLALDVSGSMGGGRCAGLEGLSPREASVAMAMALARSEERYTMVGFSQQLVPLPIGRSTRLEEALHTVSRLPFGATDCAQPMLHALQQELDVDLFVVLTDNETWCGNVHPVQALRRYRAERIQDARLMVCACSASPFSIADPKDAGMLDVCGADANLPRLMRQFLDSPARFHPFN